MALASAQVIDAVATRITGLPLAGSRVHTSRLWPLTPDDMPAWRVVAADEDIDPLPVHRDPMQKHALYIELRGYVNATADVDDEMHALAAEALTAIFDTSPPADTLAGIYPSKVQLRQARIERDTQQEGQAVLGRVTVSLKAEFRTRASTPETLS